MPTSIAEEAAQDISTYRWSKARYLEMADLGWFGNQRVELIRGEIIQLAPMGTRHFVSVMKVIRALSKVFDDDYFVVGPGILDLSTDTEPEADVIVLKAAPEDLAKGNGTNTVLVVEVSDTSLRHDRTTKVELYAEAMLKEYWIVNLRNGVIEVYRDPRKAASNGTSVGAHYAEMRTYQVGETISPLALHHIQVSVESLLPPKTD